MGKKIATEIPNLCLVMIRPQARVSPPSIQPRNQEKVYSNEQKQRGGGGEKSGPSISGQKIMIVADSTVEFKNAVQWALTHTVQNQDMLIFLHVTKPSKQGDESTTKDVEVKVPEFLTCMKNSRQIKKPEVRIEVMVVEGREKGPAGGGAEEALGDVAADADVGREGWGGAGGLLCAKCLLYGHCSEAEEQQTWWICYYH